MERIQKMTLEEKRTLTPEEKAIRKKELRKQYYRDYYANNKDTYREYQNTYHEKSDYKNKQKERLKKKYEDDGEFRSKKKLEYYKKFHNDNIDIMSILEKDNTNKEKLKNIKLILINKI